MASLKKSIAGHSSMGEIIESYIHWLTTGTTSLFQWPKLQNKKNTYNNILILNIFISQNFHTHKKNPPNWSNSNCKNQKKRRGWWERGLWVWGIQSVDCQLLGLVCGAMRGLRTKVWVWSGVKEEVEIEENGGEGKEEQHFFWSGLPIIFLHYAN